jgi:DNA-binding transcriptional MerR regulator
VAADLQLPAHVLRFWESKFPQIKPLKRRGGRRYYRPEDVALLRRIRSLLYTEGYTIKGVQRLLRESGGKPEPGESPGPTIGSVAVSTSEALPEPIEQTALSDEPEEESPAAAADTQQLRDVLRELEELRALLRKHGY